MHSLQKDWDKLGKRQRSAAVKVEAALDDMMAQVRTARDALQQQEQQEQHDAAAGSSPSATVSTTLGNASKRLKQATGDIASEHKEVHNLVSKYGKVLDKTFKSEIAGASDPKAFVDKAEHLNVAMAHHFYRQGRFQVAETFVDEANLSTSVVDPAVRERFSEMFTILQHIKNRDLMLALKWAALNRERLIARASDLEFKLFQQQYLHLVTSGNRVQAVQYAKQSFSGLSSPAHLKDVKRLMGMLLYVDRLASSPYADLISPSHWADMEHSFTREYCALIGLPSESPLYVCVSAGATALPTLLKMARVMQAKKTEWSQQDELPVELPLSKDFTYHSIFVCPVAKEQVTRTNPPMIIPCGHVICQESLNKVTKSSGRLKCPYCPTETTKTQAKRVYF